LGNFAVDPKEYLAVYDEISVPEEQQQSWFSNRRGAVVGDSLARQFGWKVGDRVTLSGTIYPGDWEFEISGIYTATRKSVDRTSFLFHYDYLNDSPIAEQMGSRDMVGWIVSRIDDPSRSAEISKAIDARFDERDIQTLSMSERALNTSFMGMISAVLKAVDAVSLVILAIMVLILGNTVAMGVRERVKEYATLRALGFELKHIVTAILGEAATLGAFGGLLCLLISYPLVERALGRFLQETAGFPQIRVSLEASLATLLLGTLLGSLAATLPARRMATGNIIESLRKVG
jgi:putative ABC transport system permease protein